MNNPLFAGLVEKGIKKILFKKSQKLLDRFLFIFFSEDRGLLPPNSITKILDQWTQLKNLDAYVPLYDRYKKYFGYLNTGFKGKEHEVYAYNGGLFKPDEILDAVLIDDELLYRHTVKLTKYDFETDVDVNILGHIFENSLNEIETVNAEIEGVAVEKKTSKRKKDGVFYTPRYITKYIVDNTVGRLCQEKKEELEITEEGYLKSRKGRKKETLKTLDDKLKVYRDWLLQITICDPACGSGAFLNQALNFLIEEHHYIDQLSSTLLDLPMVFRDVENNILENNLFGVDLNEESVEIARLSLWLRTAQKGRKLSTLSGNIKCGNSLIDDPTVAGDKAFNWQQEFPRIFRKKEKGIFHITTATHDSRTSQRMIDHKVRLKRDHGQQPKAQPIWLESEDELVITETIAEIVEKDNLNILAYNICGDHMHLLLVCEEEDMPKIVQKIKSVTAKIYNRSTGKTKAPTSSSTREHAPLSKQKEKHISLWTQKFGCNEIENDKQLWNTIEYIKTNREKHELPPNKGAGSLVKAIEKICCDYDHAFRTEHKGGFDVVIGNPPYVVYIKSLVGESVLEYINKHYHFAEYNPNTYALFTELGLSKILKSKKYLGFIIPNSWLDGQYFSRMRSGVYNRLVQQIIYLKDTVFQEVVETVILVCKNATEKYDNIILSSNVLAEEYYYIQFELEKYLNGFNPFVTFQNPLLDKLESNYLKFGNEAIVYRGLETRDNKKWLSESKKSDNYLPILLGRDVTRYHYHHSGTYVNFIKKDMKSNANEAMYQQPKILMRRTGSTIIATLESENMFALKNLYLISPKSGNNIYPLLAQLNSRLFSYFHRVKSSGENKAFAQFKGVYIESFPYVKSENSLFQELINLIINKTAQLGIVNNNLIELIQGKFEIEKLTKKLQNWHELEFSEFSKELKKAKVQLSLSEEAEWMQYFNEQKHKAQESKSEINRIDQEINQMVYELYALTQEEIEIVEGKDIEK